MDLISVIKKYSAENDAVPEMEYRYEYDAEGNSTVDRLYYDGELYMEEFYSIAVDGDFSYEYISKEIVYNDDGSRTITEYDQDYNVISNYTEGAQDYNTISADAE